MAGVSNRYKLAGYDIPKYLLDCGSKKMIELVLDMFSYQDTFHLILNKNEKDIDLIKNYLQSLSVNIKIYLIEGHSDGPVRSIQIANPEIDLSEPVIVSYCDFTIQWNYKNFLNHVEGFDAAVPYFKGFHAASLGETKFAYLKIHNQQLADLKEKESFTENRVEEPASCGIYYFKSFKYLRDLSSALFKSGLKLPNGEAYVSLLLLISLQQKEKVLTYPIKKFICLGTPKDYEQFLYWNSFFNESYEVSDKVFADNSLIPMAGEGNRFQSYGYKTLKPLIHIGNTPIFEKSVKSLPRAKKLIFILQKSHRNDRFSKYISSSFPDDNSETIFLDGPTDGQAITCLEAQSSFNKSESLLISSCDYELRFSAKSLNKLISEDVDIIVFTYKLSSLPVSKYENFAYCKVDDDVVNAIIEKSSISDNPENDQMITGTFWFRKGQFFTDGVEEMISCNHQINNEYHVGNSINFLLQKGLKVKIFEVDAWISYGDPLELNLYYFWEDFFV